jgi:SSS family solute:Na+ symporter
MQFLGPIDWLFVVLYLLVIGGVSIWSIRKSKETTSDYFLANRNLGWFVIGASILASNVGSEHIVGLAGSAAKSGAVLGHYELHSYIVLILGWVFVPFYIRSSVYTMPEFLEKRFNPQARRLLTIIQLISYVIAKASVTIFAGALVFNQFLGVDFWTGAIILVVVTGVYTIFGGLHAVMYTEAIQAIVLLSGSFLLLVFGLREVGGWDSLMQSLPKEKLNMFLPLNDPEFPWLGILFASPIVGVWYWCTDQHIVQRCLAAKNEQEARRGTIFAALLKLLPFFIFLIPGLIAYTLSAQGKIQLDDANAAFPVMVKAVMPIGLRGVLAGGLLAALMGSLASVYNACSTLYTIDIYKKSHPNATEKELVKVGRIATGVIVLMGMAWIPMMGKIDSGLYNYLQSVQSYLAPPISAVFLLGVFFKRLNAKGAYTSMVAGFILGMAKLCLQIFKDSLAPSGYLYQFATMNFLYFCIWLFLFSIVVFVTISLMTAAPSEEKVRGLTFATTVAEDKAASRATWNWVDVTLSIFVLAVILGIFLYFSPLGIAK